MKRQGRLFEKAFSMANLYEAYLAARSGKRKRRAVYGFEKSLGANLEELYREIHSGEYRLRDYFTFNVYEPKKRLIYAPRFRDVVVQHAIYRLVYPIFDRSFLRNSFACRYGYGTHRASQYAWWALKASDPEKYILKLDVRKYFYSIDRTILRALIERKIKDRRLVDIMMQFAVMDSPAGIPIGNLMSQLYALIYLNPLDHYIKRELKVEKYVRYVDDFILFDLTRDEGIALLGKIKAYLWSALGLTLSRVSLHKVKRGINFVGYRTWKAFRLIRKHSLYKYRRAVKGARTASICSLLGHARETASLGHMIDLLRMEKENGKDISIPKSYRPLYNTRLAAASRSGG